MFSASSAIAAINDYKSKHSQIFMTFSIEVTNPQDQLVNALLTKKSEVLLAERGMDALKERCGEKVDVGDLVGGFLRGFVRFTSESQSDLDSFANKLQATGQYKALSYKADITFDKELIRDYENVQAEVFVRSYGGRGVSLPSYKKLEDFEELIKGWPQRVADNPRHIEDIEVRIEDIAKGIVRDPYYDRADNVMRRARQYIGYLQAMKSILIGEGGYDRNNIELTATNIEELKDLDDGNIRLEETVVGCYKAEYREECQLYKVEEIYLQYGHSEVRVPHHSCHRKLVKVTKSNRRVCGEQPGKCLKYDLGVAESTKTFFLGSFGPRKRDGDPWLESHEMAQAKQLRQDWMGRAMFDRAAYPEVCRDNNAHLGYRFLGDLDYKWSCRNEEIDIMHGPPCFPSTEDIIRQEPEVSQDGVMFASVEAAVTACDFTSLDCRIVS